ncbi:retrovirus-related pol polyprotein from transposon TNT 1-94 [Tanacetum coccineum]
MHMLTEPQIFYDDTHKQALGYQNLFNIIKAQQIQPTLHDGSVIAKEHAVISVIDDEETLILEEQSRSKMLDKQNDPNSIEKKIKISPIEYSKLNQIKEDFGKCFVTKKELSTEQALSLKHSYISETLVMSHTPVRIKARSELTKGLGSQGKDTVIRKLKDRIKSLSGKDSVETVKKDIDEIETINIELEHSTDIAKITRKKLKRDKNGHGNGKSTQKMGKYQQWLTKVNKVAFLEKHLPYMELEGVDLHLGSQATQIWYTISLDDMLKTSPICLYQKHQRLRAVMAMQTVPFISHLNFGTFNKLTKDGLARGIPKLKFQKDHLCSVHSLGKRNKSSHQPKAEDTNQEKLYLLHMYLYGPMRMESIKVKKYILVIVDDYSRFTWVKFLRSKDEAPDAIIKCIKNIQVPTRASSFDSCNIQFKTRTKHIPKQPCNPPKRVDCDTLFQHLFDEYFNPPTIAVSTVPVAVAPRAVEIADSLVSTSIGQDAPSSKSPKTPLFHDDPLHESLHEDSTSQGSSSNVRPSHTPFELIGRWTKDHPIANVIANKNMTIKKGLSDDTLVIPLEELRVDDKLHFVEEPVEVMDRETKKLKRSRIPIIKVRWNSKRGLEFT